MIGRIALLGLALTSAGLAQDRASDSIVQKVDDHYNHLSSLRTRYTERYAGLGMNKVESGTLLLKKPGRMRWIYDEPAGKVFVLDGKWAWSYAPGDAQVQRTSAKQMDDLRSPLRFLLGHTQLKKELDSLSVTSAGGSFRITGVPKGMQGKVTSLSLDVTAAGLITRMRVDEEDGSQTEFQFSGMEENVPLANSEFTYTPPAGVTVVEGLPPV